MDIEKTFPMGSRSGSATEPPVTRVILEQGGLWGRWGTRIAWTIAGLSLLAAVASAGASAQYFQTDGKVVEKYHSLAKFAPAGSPRVSGYLLGEKYLQGMAAALDVVHGKGHVVLIGFRPQWRGQPFGTFRVMFNAALFGRDVAAASRVPPPRPSCSKKAAAAGTAPGCAASQPE